MFQLQQQPAYWWPVPIPMPKDGGGWERREIELQFKYLDADQYRQLMERVRAEKLGDAAVCREIVTGWRKVVQVEGGPETPFTPEHFAGLLRVPNAAAAIVREFVDSHTKAAQGNS